MLGRPAGTTSTTAGPLQLVSTILLVQVATEAEIDMLRVRLRAELPSTAECIGNTGGPVAGRIFGDRPIEYELLRLECWGRQATSGQEFAMCA